MNLFNRNKNKPTISITPVGIQMVVNINNVFGEPIINKTIEVMPGQVYRIVLTPKTTGKPYYTEFFIKAPESASVPLPNIVDYMVPTPNVGNLRMNGEV